MTTSDKFATPVPSDEQAIRFFREIKNELGIPCSQKMVSVVRCILSQLRKSLTHEQTSILLQKLPDTFQLLLVSDWRYDEKETTLRHLDELADRVYTQTDGGNRKFFSTEIEALNTVLHVFKKLDKFFGLFEFNVLHYTITEEIKQAAELEDAA